MSIYYKVNVYVTETNTIQYYKKQISSGGKCIWLREEEVKHRMLMITVTINSSGHNVR